MTREEAIGKLRQWSLPKETREILEALVPELKESEDERIRKHLIEIVETYWGTTNDPCKAADLAYLEKQKEHQETCTTFLAKILKHSAEGFRNVLKKKGINYIPHESFWTNTAGTFSKQECNEFYKWMDDMTMELVTEETPEYKKGFKDGLDASKKEPKPAEWSEFDKDKLEQCIRIVSGWEVDYDIVKSPYSNFLKSLPERFNLQPKNEWSEKDEECRKEIIEYIEQRLGDGTSGQALWKKWHSWLKSLPERFNLQPKQKWSEEECGRLFDIEHYLDGTLQLSPDRKIACIDFLKSLRPQLSDEDIKKIHSEEYTKGFNDAAFGGKAWKPNEEQMTNLINIRDYVGHCSGYWGEVLDSLIEDLNKLM